MNRTTGGMSFSSKIEMSGDALLKLLEFLKPRNRKCLTGVNLKYELKDGEKVECEYYHKHEVDDLCDRYEWEANREAY